MSKVKKNNKVIKYRKVKNINIGIIIFLFLLTYLLVCIYQYAAQDQIRTYEVREGEIARSSIYTGIIRRDEEILTSGSSGFINLYLREESRINVGGLLYTVDGSGIMSSLLEQAAAEGNSLSAEDLQSLKNQLYSFSSNFNALEFSDVYGIQADLETTVLEFLNRSLLENANTVIAQYADSFYRGESSLSGNVLYYIDGYESLTDEQVSQALLDKPNYSKQTLSSGRTVAAGETIAKIITSDEWDIYIPITEEDKAAYMEESNVLVNFTGTDIEEYAEVSFITGSNGESYAKLHFYRYMIQFAQDRYLELELVQDNEKGLKIPKTAVLEKDFYIIPAGLLATGGDSQDSGFYLESYEEGNLTSTFITPTIIYSTEEYCYVAKSDIETGSSLIYPDSSERFQVGATESLRGVYNVNKGYAVFRRIEIIDENEEYYIVTNNSAYGLSLYDQIVLDSSKVEENDIIFS